MKRNSTALGYIPLDVGDYWNAVGESEVRPTRGSIDEILGEKVRCLSTILSEIQGEIDKRNSLSEDVINRIYSHYFYVKAKVFEMALWPMNGLKAVELRRSNLEGTLDTLLNEKRREQVLCSQDITNLRRDFWRWFKEYCDLVQRVQIVSGNRNAQPKRL